ncbi:MAG: phenylalanine--tRNA ligase subunit beta [Halieaceae bacterium]|nr:phenylalanine--tRNA ligase subunit beta [Halieaceae bacterium]
MILSENWLREWVNPDLDTEALAHRLTMAGLEVDSITPLAEGLSGVVVAEITAAEQHPDADKLRVCAVNTGTETVQIVCGAPNAAQGLKAPLAQPGGRLPGGIKIKKAKLRGVESQGMLCSGAELGLSDDHDGLLSLAADAPVGMPIEDYLDLNDQLIEIGLTPNRADCLSVMGVARDLAVMTDQPLKAPTIDAVAASIDECFPIEVTAPEKCPRYLGRVIRNVDVSRPTPLAIVERLRRAGIRSIDAVVDITNYVMLELGQPLHAFDLETLEGGIRVREAESGEKITLLDGEERALNAGTLLIADHKKPLAMAGIMGGEGSGIGPQTKHLLLEAAYFAPELIAGRARQYGLHTDASHRYERGVDPELAYQAMERATALLLECVGGDAASVVDVTSPSDLPRCEPVLLRKEAVDTMLGIDVADDEITRIFSGLGFKIVPGDRAGTWKCTAPSWRFDMGREADLIEEIARTVGYDNIPVALLSGAASVNALPETQLSKASIKQRLVGRGFSEAITFSFVSPELQQQFDPELAPVSLQNPISSDLAVMRTSLIPGLVAAASHNIKRQQSRVKLFETGLRFMPGETVAQEPMMAMIMCGSRLPEAWSAKAEAVDFYDLKGEIEALLCGDTDGLSFRPAVFAGLHDGQTAEILLNDCAVGVTGRLHPLTARALDMPAATFVAELRLAEISQVSVPSFQEISKFPEIRRDIAVIVNREIPAQAVLDCAQQAAGGALAQALIFDVYEGEGVDPTAKSLAIGLTFRDQSRTLTDEEITASLSQVIESLGEKLGATLRH